MQFKGIIFDFNGVLWWDSHLQEQSWNQFAREIRGVSLSAAETAIRVHGRTNRYTLEYLLNRPVNGPELLQLTTKGVDLWGTLFSARRAIRTFPGRY